MPSMPSDLMRDGWASWLTTTWTAGAPKSPWASTSQPTRCSTAWRAAASAVKLATVAPVTNAPPQPAGQGECVQQPAQGDFFEGGGNRRGGEDSGVLIPGRSQPVRTQRGGQRAADDEAEEPWSGDAHGGRRTEFIEHADDVFRRGGDVREGLMKAGEGGDGFVGRTDAPVLDIFEVLRGTQRDGVQEFPHLAMVAKGTSEV